MKMIRSVVVCSATLFAGGAAIAQTSSADHAAHHPAGTEASAKTTAALAEAKSLDESIQVMQAQMARIRGAQNPAERKALLDQHMQSMHQHFEMMKSAMGKSAGAVEPGTKGSPKGMMNCGQMMGGDMDMMQKMMGQMQQHLDAEGKAAASK